MLSMFLLQIFRPLTLPPAHPPSIPSARPPARPSPALAYPSSHAILLHLYITFLATVALLCVVTMTLAKLSCTGVGFIVWMYVCVYVCLYVCCSPISSRPYEYD